VQLDAVDVAPASRVNVARRCSWGLFLFLPHHHHSSLFWL